MSEPLEKIRCNIDRLLTEILPSVTILAACKGRSAAEVQAAYQAGLRCFGHNYVQEALSIHPQLDLSAQWHMIGHLQRNKAGAAIELFDSIDTVDSLQLAQELEKRCASSDRQMNVMIEVNSGREENKSGTLPEDAVPLAEFIAHQPHLHLHGIMTMGPLVGDEEESRPYFVETRKVYEQIAALNLARVNLRYLSMGMSNNYQVAIREGANMVRLGTVLFGERK
jgi:pyridoxal phosphate enzyme (YggS family)